MHTLQPGRKALLIIQKAAALLLLLHFFLPSFSQEQKLHYDIRRNGKKVGDLQFHKQREGAAIAYLIQSEVKVKMIMSITVKAKEQSLYENGVLQSSMVMRHVNGRQKANKQIKNNGTGLTVSEGGKETELKNYKVKYNTHCLYTLEPSYFTNVFSDNYQLFIPIQKLASHHYKLTFPDGNSNEYFYENGICRRVKVKSQLFDAEFVLTSP